MRLGAHGDDSSGNVFAVDDDRVIILDSEIEGELGIEGDGKIETSLSQVCHGGHMRVS